MTAASADPGQPLRRPRGKERTQPLRTVPAPVDEPASPPTGGIRGLLGPMTGSIRIGRGRDDETVQALRVDWPQCKGHGLCAEIAPEIVHLDEWGYPMLERTTLSGDDLAVARKAVQVCPTLALRLVDPPQR